MAKAIDRADKTEKADFPFPQLETTFAGALFPAYAQMCQSVIGNALAFNQEVMRFANERVQANAQLLRDLPQCAKWENAISVQSDFARSATSAYAAEMPRLTERAIRTCTAIWTPAVEPATSPSHATETKMSSVADAQ